MKNCSCLNYYEKYNEAEPIEIGDAVSLVPETDKIVRSVYCRKWNNNTIVGICVDIKDSQIVVSSSGMVDVNVDGIICLGDKLTSSEKPGKLVAIRYDTLDGKIFDIRSIGKVIGLYNNYSKAKVLLDVE